VTVIATPGDQLLSITGLPTGLKRPSVPLSSFYGGGVVQLSGENRAVSYTWLYRTQPWIATAVNKLTRLIAGLPLQVYEKDSQNNRREVHDHALAQLLSKPYPRGGPVHLKQRIAMPVLLHGNGLVLKDRPGVGRPPSMMQPVDWRNVIPHGSSGIEGPYIPGAVEYWEVVDEGGARKFIDPDETLHFGWEAPDGSIGVSPLQQLGVTLLSEDAAQRYTAANFRNGARPSGAVVLPEGVHGAKYREVRDDIRQEVAQEHGGVDNAGSVMVLSGGADWKAFAQSAVEVELIKARLINREEIAAVYDIPQSIIGILDHATYSNITEQHRILYMTVLGPWLTLVEETIKAQLIDPEPSWEGLFVEFDVSEQLKGAPLDRAKAAALWLTHGVYTINEQRTLENLAPIDNAVCDTPLIPVNNMAPATSLNPQDEQPTDVPAIDPTLASHIARAADRVLRKTSAGSSDPWDRDRFARELDTDLRGKLDARVSAQVAGGWAQALTAIVDDADGDVDALRRSFAALTR
jgi:HK97 family phage portal protein